MRPNRRRGRGFTLIEMLVVVLVMGLLVGLVAAATRPVGRDSLRTEAERLAQLLDLAGEEARLGGKPVAWTSDGQTYHFWRWRNGTGWTEIRDDPLHARRLPDDMSIPELRVEGGRRGDAMRIEFSPYGAQPAYGVALALGGERRTILGSPMGEVSIASVPAASAAESSASGAFPSGAFSSGRPAPAAR
ncbi:MAG TPA: GspH/FimT family pseudopilin [Burkholderiales bacterium]|nr:GspH/FimT family pseudopilin [Burkholderiales bacterium]